MDLLVEICGHKRRSMILDTRLELCAESKNSSKQERSLGVSCIYMERGSSREWSPALCRALWLGFAKEVHGSRKYVWKLSVI